MYGVAVRFHIGHGSDDLRPPQPGKARQRRNGSGRVSEKIDENGFFCAEVHIGQQVQDAAFAQDRDDGLDAIAFPHGAAVGKAATAAAHPAIHGRIALRAVDGDTGAGSQQGHQQHALSIHAQKMRGKHDGGGVGQKSCAVACPVDATLQQDLAAVPQPDAIEQGLSQPHAVLTDDVLALGGVQFGKAQLQIDVGNAFALACQIQ